MKDEKTLGADAAAVDRARSASEGESRQEAECEVEQAIIAKLRRRSELVDEIVKIDKDLGAALTALGGNDPGDGFNGGRHIPVHYQGMTIREVVTAKLKERPGSRASDVTKALRAEGFSLPKRTRFSHRIYNEVWRMKKDGLVTRTESGGFKLIANGNQATLTEIGSVPSAAPK